MMCEQVLAFYIDKSYSTLVEEGKIQVIVTNNVSNKSYTVVLPAESYRALIDHLEALEINPLAFMLDAVKLLTKDKDSE